jgi:prevent-host-death family protein
MDSVGVRDLRARTSEILRRVSENKETIEVTSHGRPIARIVPIARREVDKEKLREMWASLDDLSARIGERWPEGVSAVDAIREQRRDL